MPCPCWDDQNPGGYGVLTRMSAQHADLNRCPLAAICGLVVAASGGVPGDDGHLLHQRPAAGARLQAREGGAWASVGADRERGGVALSGRGRRGRGADDETGMASRTAREARVAMRLR